MSDTPTPRLPDPETAYRAVVRALREEDGLPPRAVPLLDFLGKAMGLSGATRRELAARPLLEGPDAATLPALLRPFLADAPEEVRADAAWLVGVHLGADPTLRVPEPFCPVCKVEGRGRATRIWSSPPGTGLGPLEGTCATTWSCGGCRSLLDCVDRLDGPDRFRMMRIRVTGPEMLEFDTALEAAGPEEVVRVLRKGPTAAWMLERLARVAAVVEETLAPTRAALAEEPSSAPEAYAQRGGLVLLGPPPTQEVWSALLEADLPEGLLSLLAPLPGAPRAVREALLSHADPEVRHQALQAPDVPHELLLRTIRLGDTGAQLSLLDRADVGSRTLALLLERRDPHVLYRAGRHPALDLPLLSHMRRARRVGLPDLLPPTRVLHVYAPSSARSGTNLLERIGEHILEQLSGGGWEGDPPAPGPEDAEPGMGPEPSMQLVCVRTSLSRVLVYLPPSVAGIPDSLEVERLLESLKQSLLASVAEEVVELALDEAAGFWEADIRQRGGSPQRVVCSDLPPPEPDAPEGKWLEFELFVAERALAFPGLPAPRAHPRLVTRPPYTPHPGSDPGRQVLRFRRSPPER